MTLVNCNSFEGLKKSPFTGTLLLPIFTKNVIYFFIDTKLPNDQGGRFLHQIDISHTWSAHNGHVDWPGKSHWISSIIHSGMTWEITSAESGSFQ